MKRAAAASGAALIIAATVLAPPGWALERPEVDPGALPADGPPGPAEEMEQTSACRSALTIAQPDVTQPAPATEMLNLPEAWKYSTGAGVTVAVIDTGVTPSPRLPNLVGGGDYVMGRYGDGLQDCQVHGTIVASLIAAQPAGTPAPARRPENAPAAPPVTGVAPPIPSPASTTPPPPSPTTVTVTVAPAPAPPPPPPPPEEGDMHPANGNDPNGADVGDTTIVAPPPPGAPDGMVGVAPGVDRLVSVRQSSETHGPKDYKSDADRHRKAGDVQSLAAAVRHTADLPGVRVINISVVNCINAATPVDQAALGAALRYAAVDKDIVIVAAAGNSGNDCPPNPGYNPLHPEDPRNWSGAQTIVAPAWFSDYVLSVGAIEPAGPGAGQPAPFTMPGPWVQLGAPGDYIMGLGPNGTVVNAYPNVDPGKPPTRIFGSSFAAPIVTGVAALVRAYRPELSAAQVIRRLVVTARPPAGGVDNRIGYGIVDPVAALTKDVAEGPRLPEEHLSATSRLINPPPPPGRDMSSTHWGGVVAAVIVTVAAVLFGWQRRRS